MPVHDSPPLVEIIDSRLVELHRGRVAELGIEGSGLPTHYAELLARGTVFREQDIQAFNLVRNDLPAHDRYVVFGAGLGVLALLLNSAGLRVVACEPSMVRLQALEAGLDNLVKANAAIREDFVVVPGVLPGVVEGQPLLALATDFIVDVPLERDDAFCTSLRQFDGLLVNPRLFIRRRESASEQRAAVEFLRDLGFYAPMEFPVEQLLYFRRRLADRRSAPASPAVMARQGVASVSTLDDTVGRLMRLVPRPPPSRSDTTWVERRRQVFDLVSPLGDDA